MVSRTVRVVVLVAIVGIVGCGRSAEPATNASGCPEGSTRREAINEIAGPGAATREDAVRAELENIGVVASDDAISAGVVAAGPGGNVGTEEVQMPVDDGTVVTMTLTPLDPGWAVESSSWCAPA